MKIFNTVTDKRVKRTANYYVNYYTKRTSKSCEMVVKAGAEPTLEQLRAFDKNAEGIYSIRYIFTDIDYSGKLALMNID